MKKPQMTPKIFYFVLVGVSALLVVGGGVNVLFANSILKNHSKDVVDLKLQNQVLDEQVAAYRRAKTDLTKFKDLQDLVERVVPAEKDQARIVRELVKLANDNGIQISSINFPSSTLGTKQAAPVATVGTATGTVAIPPLSQAKPVSGLNGVYAMQTSLIPLIDSRHTVTYNQLLSFLNKLELNRRTMQITNLQVTPKGATTASGISFQLTVNIFIKP